MKPVLIGPEYAEQILEIFNDAILNSTALYDYRPRNMDNMKKWFDDKFAKSFPVTGLVDPNGQLLAFGTYGIFRDRPAYKYTVEHSLYVHKNQRGNGLGKLILAEIIRLATEQQFHCLIAGIDSSNLVSVRLHEQFGFEYCGKIREVGYKFSSWLDLEFYQLLLPVPAHPSDG